jgi:hypothetical protein
MVDSLNTRCFFIQTTPHDLVFDYWLDANPRFAAPFLDVYTCVNVTNGRGPLYHQTAPISKARVPGPLLFAVTDVHKASQLALNVNFTDENLSITEPCEFGASPIWNGSGLTLKDDPNIVHLKQCNGTNESEVLWMYLAYEFVADAVLVAIITAAWCAFRHWQRQKPDVLQTVGQKQQYQPQFGRRGSSNSLMSIDRGDSQF